MWVPRKLLSPTRTQEQEPDAALSTNANTFSTFVHEIAIQQEPAKGKSYSESRRLSSKHRLSYAEGAEEPQGLR